jgi:hypothetical protein
MLFCIGPLSGECLSSLAQYKGKVCLLFLAQYKDLTIYALMIYTAPCVRFLMRADRSLGEVGALEIESFMSPMK